MLSKITTAFLGSSALLLSLTAAAKLYSATGRHYFAASLFRTLSAVFAAVRIHGVGNGTDSGNLFFVASASKDIELRPVSTDGVYAGVRDDVIACLASRLTVDPSAGRVMTDDFNPVDYFDAANREKHRRMLAFSIRDNL